MNRFHNVVGETIRRTRLERGLTLSDVRSKSRGRFKPSALGGYERGERSITLERFCDLASLYEIPPDRLLTRVCEALDPEGRREIVIDLNRLSEFDDDVHVLVDFIYRMRSRRRDYLGEAMTLRSGDVEELALEFGIKPRTMLDRLRAVMRASATTSLDG